MIDRAALAAVARAVEHGGDIDAATAAVAQADPWLRSAARRRLRAAHADALLATREKHADGGRHALRLAYLLLARALPARGARDDVEAVTAAYDEARARRPATAGFWWPTSILVATLVAGGAAALVMARAEGAPPAPVLAVRAGPTVRGAFATGGVPAPGPDDAVVRRVFSADVPAFLIGLDHGSDARRAGSAPAALAAAEAEMAAARALALGPDARRALGDGVGNALEALLGAARAAAQAGAGDPGDRADEGVSEAAGALDDALAAADLGYFVDGDVIHDGQSGRRLVIAYAFAVEQVHVFSAGAAGEVRALHLRRIDHLNWSHALLGFTRPHLRAAAVLFDQLDEQVLTLVAPGLGAGAAVPLFEPEADRELRAAVEARAGELARAEYLALPGIDAAAAGKLGELLGRRRTLFQGWEKRATERGLTLVIPGTLRLADAFLKSLSGFASKGELAELRAIDEALGGAAEGKAFLALGDALAASVERHEVQHRLDVARRSPVMPQALADKVGPLRLDGRESPRAAAARAELSAYLAELARDARTGRFGLAMVARFLFDRRLHGSSECYAALVILEGLAAELGVPAAAPLVADHTIDRRGAGRLYLELVKQPPERLRAAAKKLWERLFEAPLPELRLIGPKEIATP
jgi:hypothetical protein